MPLSSQETANLTRWEKSKKPFYEVYYLKWNDPSQGIAAWLRYTLLAPIAREPEVSVWGIFFNAANPQKNLALKQTYSLHEARIEREIFYFAAGPSAIFDGGARGELSGEKGRLSWELKFEGEGQSLQHFPAPLYWGEFPKTKLLAPYLSTRLSGEFVVNNQTFSLQNVPAHQAHLWGTEMAPAWVWGNCNSFQEDPDFFFEGLSVPPFTLLFFFWEGRWHRFGGPVRWFLNRSQHDLDRWHFEASERNLRFVGDLFSDPSSMVGVRYEDPTGKTRYCHNTKVANLKIQILQKRHAEWECIKTLSASKSAAFESVGPRHDSRVRLMIP